MSEMKRFDVFFENHIGFGIRWEHGQIAIFAFDLSIALPFITFSIGFGKRKP
ncbi:MAG: hypothetical protein ACTSVO_05710 [Candidatus Heimdallarchaeaceae archaeon]